VRNSRLVPPDAALAAGPDAALAAGPDAALAAGPDAALAAGPAAGLDGGSAAGLDPGLDAGAVAGLDAGSVAALFREHHGELVRLALLMVGDLPTAEDVVQDVYASLHARSAKVTAYEAPLPYVRVAVLNGCRTVIRRRGIARRVGVLHRASLHDEALASAESEVILSEERREVLAALARLSRRRREVLVLRYYLGLPEAEIAVVLGISAGTVKSTAARALAVLARDLGEKA
jgi:RNA polymerase sigma-70 factor (sigma-E family)